MQEISLSDTIEQFMTKCNANFNEITERSGPQGRPGEDGHVGATGKRGNNFRLVPMGDEQNPTFSVEDANAAIHDMNDLEVGDVVIFSNGCFGSVSDVVEEGSEYVPKISAIYNTLIGPQGEQGETGSQASGQFDEAGGYLKLKDQYSGLRISRGNSSPTDLLVDKTTYNYAGSPKGFIQAESNDFKIKSTLNISLESPNITVGNQSTADIKITGSNLHVGTAVNFIEIGNASGINVQGNSEFSDTAKFKNDVIFDKNGQQTTIKGDIVTTSALKSNSLSIDITTPATYANRKLTIDGGGVNFVGKFSISPTLVKTSLQIDSDSKIRVKSGNEYIILDCPKYTMMLWPDGSDCPTNWRPLNRNIYISGVERVGTTLQNGEISDTTLYFKFNDYIYRVENYTSKISDTLVVAVESSTGGNIPSEDVTQYIASPESRSNLTAADQPLSMRINNTGDTSFTDRPMSSDQTQMLASAFADYSEIYLDGELVEALEPAALPETLVSAYAGFLKNMLKVRVQGSNRHYKDMTGVFTLIKKSISQTTNLSFVFGRPQAPAGFMWIFKNA